MLGYLSADIIREANSFPRAKLEENCELRGTDNVQGQISEHIFAPNGGYCLYYPSNIFRSAHNFENWGMFSDIPQFEVGNIQSRDVFRPKIWWIISSDICKVTLWWKLFETIYFCFRCCCFLVLGCSENSQSYSLSSGLYTVIHCCRPDL